MIVSFGYTVYGRRIATALSRRIHAVTSRHPHCLDFAHRQLGDCPGLPSLFHHPTEERVVGLGTDFCRGRNTRLEPLLHEHGCARAGIELNHSSEIAGARQLRLVEPAVGPQAKLRILKRSGMDMERKAGLTRFILQGQGW